MTRPSPAALRDRAVEVATVAAERVRARAGAPDLRITTKSSLTDPVTEVDQEVEALIVDALLAVRPDDGVLGEEGADRPGTSGVRWIIDPIDGTVDFMYGIPGCNVSIAAEVDGVVVAGVVIDPLHGDTFAAARGEGATRNGHPIRCTGVTDLGLALLGTGFGYDPDERRRQAAVLAHVLPRVRDIRRVGAAAIDLCWVACGRLDGYYERNLKTWDWAAGALVAEEAGATVGTVGDRPLPEALPQATIVASGPALFGPLRGLLADAGERP
jgi:fructose-1,6-bisphosphatase/inositol monophosphatase family enzyme